MGIKKYVFMMLVVLAMVFAASSAFALNATELTVKMDGRVLDESQTTSISAFEKDDVFEIDVIFELDGADNEKFENVQVEARIRGYNQRDLIQDITNSFNVVANTKYKKTLKLKLPVRMDDGDYKLRVSILDAFSEEVSRTYDLKVVSSSRGIWIRDVVLSPENEVEAGRALLATVRLQNIGDYDEKDGVRVKVVVPSLGISATDYIDEIVSGRTISSEELYMRVPQCAELGKHEVGVEVIYHDGDEVEYAKTYINVVGGELCDAKPTVPTTPTPQETQTITAGVDVQNVVAGSGGAIYPITVTNMASTARTFTIVPDVESWATVRVSPSNVMIVQPGHTETAYVYVSANEDAILGQNIFAVTVKAGANTLEQFVLTANVVAGEKVSQNESWDSVRRTLEIGLVVLVIILVILGLVIGLRKMKKDDGDDEAQTYY